MLSVASPNIPMGLPVNLITLTGRIGLGHS
jgi:hypothetical protein